MSLALEGTPQNVDQGNVLPAFTTSLPSQVFIAGNIDSSMSVASISGGGLTWSQRARAVSGGDSIQLWTAQAAAPLAGMVATLTFSGSPTFRNFCIFAFSGQNDSTIFDPNASVPAVEDSQADPILISTDNPDDVIIACFLMAGISNPTAGSGFTQISGQSYFLVEYKIVSAPQTNLSCGVGNGSGFAAANVADALMGAPPSSVALSGDATTGINEGDVAAGGKQIVLTLTGDIWIP
jgi:hypothetical protein